MKNPFKLVNDVGRGVVFYRNKFGLLLRSVILTDWTISVFLMKDCPVELSQRFVFRYYFVLFSIAPHLISVSYTTSYLDNPESTQDMDAIASPVYFKGIA